MLFEDMAEKIYGLSLNRNDEPVFFAGLSLNVFAVGFELYEGLLRVNFGMLMFVVRW